VVTIDGSPPAVEARVLVSKEAKGASIERGKVLGRVALDSDFVVILEVGSNARKIRDDGNVELLQLGGRTNTTELENLRGIVDTSSDNDLAGSSGTAFLASGISGQRAGLVEVLAVKELDTGSTGRLRVIKGDLGDVGVGSHVERVLLGAVLKGGVSDRENELTGSDTTGLARRKGNLVVSRVLVASGSVGVGIAGNEVIHGDVGAADLAQSNSASAEEAEELLIAKRDAERSSLGAEPAIVAVAILSSGQVSVLLQLDKVLAHVLGRPRVITSEGGDILKVRLVRVHSNQGIVSCASTQGLSTRVQSSLELRALGRVETSVLAAIGGLVGGLVVAGLSCIVGVMMHKEVPGNLRVLRGVGGVGRDRVVDRVVVLTSLDEKSLVTSQSETSGQGTTTSTRTNNDVLIAGKGDCVDRSRSGQKAVEERVSHADADQ
jgi:hypothetical protein